MLNQLYIDNIDVYSSYGVYVKGDSLKGLVTMPSFKNITSNDWHEHSGVDVDLTDLVLAGRQFSMTFYATRRILSATAQRFVDFLSQQVYHTFYFPLLQMQWTLRYVSSSSFDTNDYFDTFTLTFADDSPVIYPTAPTASRLMNTDSQLDGLPFSYYGCVDTAGTLSSLHRLAGLKDNLSSNIRNVSGLIYDGSGTPVFKYGDVTMKLHMRTSTVYDFWHDYHALFYALIRTNSNGEAKRTLSDGNIVVSCFYKSSTVDRFRLLDNGGVWCDFSVTFGIISVDSQTPNWQYLATEEGGEVITENTYPEFVIIDPPAIIEGASSGGNGGDRVVRISELPTVNDNNIGGLVTIGVDSAGNSVKVPLGSLLSKGAGFYNLDNEHPLTNGEWYTLATAVAAVASDNSISAEAKNGMIITFYDGGEWKTYRYKNTYDPADSDAASYFSDSGNWEEFQSGGGGGGSVSEDVGRIILRRLNGDIIAKVGSTVQISFSYDHVTGTGEEQQSTGNAAQARIIINRAGYQQVLTRSLIAGNYVEDISRYMGIGTTTVRLQVTVDTGLSTQSAAVSWLVSEVQLHLSTNDLTGYIVVERGNLLEVNYTLESGSNDTKSVICYVNGVQYAQNTIATSVGNGSFTIDTSSLGHGRHTVQLRAQQSTGQMDENNNVILIYSNLIYAVVGVYTTVGTMPLLTMFVNIEDGSRVYGSGESLELTVNQYDTLSFAYGARSKDSITTSVTINAGGATVLTATNSREEATYSARMLVAGTKTYVITAANSAQISFTVTTVAVQLGVNVPNNRTLFLDSVAHGHSNSDSNKNTWTSTTGSTTTNTTMSGFSWSSDGWVNGALRLKDTARAVVNYKPLQLTNSGGSVVGFRYRCTGVKVTSENQKVITCLDSNGTGFFITPTEITMQQNGNVRASMKTAEGDIYDVAFVVWPASGNSTDARKNAKFIYLYIDGIISGGYRLADGTSLFQTTAVPITLGNSGVTTDIFRVWAYNRALNDSEMLDTYILDQDNDLDYLLEKRDNNMILDATGNITPDSLPDGTRIMVITGQARPSGGSLMASVLAAATENSKKKYFPCTEISSYIKGATDRSKNFIARCNGSDMVDGEDMSLKLRLQGTSSLAYPVKNYRIYTKKSTMYVGNNPEMPFGETGTVASGGKFAMHDGSAPVAVWCTKADYAESSSTHNTGMACMVNDTLKNIGVLTPAQRDVNDRAYPYEVRTTVDGEPCVLFYRETLADQPVFLGKFNFNNDKSTEAVFGFTGISGYHDEAPLKDISNSQTHFTAQQYYALHRQESGYADVGDLTECWEFRNNEDPMGSFLSDDFTSTTVNDDGETVRKWTGTFEARYPDNDGLNADFASGAIVPHYLSRLVSWVKATRVESGDSAQQAAAKLAKFKSELPLYFDVEHLCCYFVFTQIMACLDQMVKNMMMAFWYDKKADDSSPMGRVRAYMIFYDNDTILGVINNGRLLAPYDVMRDTVQLYDANNNPVYFYAGHESVLWNNLTSQYATEIRNAYVKIRGYLTNSRIFEFFDERQASKFCERIYNLDALNKYVAPANMAESAVAPYRDLMQGSRKSHRHYFIEKRLSMLDNNWRAGEYYSSSNEISFKGISAGGSSITFTIRQDGNVEVKSDVSDDFVQNYPTTGNVSRTITKLTQSAVGTIIHVYGMRQLTKLNVSQWDFDQLNLGNFQYLEEFVFGSFKQLDGTTDNTFVKPYYSNPLVVGDSMPYLKKFVAQKCVALPSADLSECTMLEEIDLSGSTAMSSIAIPVGIPLVKYCLPTNGISAADAANASPYNLNLVSLPLLDEYDSTTGNGLSMGNPSRILRLTFRDCPNINIVPILISIATASGTALQAVDVTLPSAVSGPASMLKALLRIWNGLSGENSNLRIFGKYTVNDTLTNADCNNLGYNPNNAGTEQQLQKIYGLTLVISQNNIVSPLLQSFNSSASGYNPAVCVALANKGLGEFVNPSDPTQGWYMTKDDVEAIVHVPKGTFNAGTFVDTLGVCGTVGASYDFTTFIEFYNFKNISYMTDGVDEQDRTGIFKGASKLETVYLPYNWNVSVIFQNGCISDGLGGVASQNNVGIFSGCSALTTINSLNQMAVAMMGIPDIFHGCSANTNLNYFYNMPSGVTILRDNAFYGCTQLNWQTLWATLTSIGASVFYGCTNIRPYTLPSNLTTVGDSAFWGCTKLTGLTIPASVTSIGNSAFRNCSALRAIYMNSSTPPSIGTDVFTGLPSSFIIYVPSGRGSAYRNATNWSAWSSHIREQSDEGDVE